MELKQRGTVEQKEPSAVHAPWHGTSHDATMGGNPCEADLVNEGVRRRAKKSKEKRRRSKEEGGGGGTLAKVRKAAEESVTWPHSHTIELAKLHAVQDT